MFTLNSFAKTRPFLYHLTARSNLDSILAAGTLTCASQFLSEAGASEWKRRRRPECVSLPMRGGDVCIRDQAPLYQGNVSLAPGWEFGDLVSYLNDHVYSWPGTDCGPIDYGLRHFSRYISDGVVVLRVPTESTFAENANPPLFCRFNSGSPRCSNGKKPPRGPDTFAPAPRFDGGPSKVVEVVFYERMILPADHIEAIEVTDFAARKTRTAPR